MKLGTGPLSTAPHAARQRAGLILAVLLAHLLLMASPLHDERIWTSPAEPVAGYQSTLTQYGPIALGAMAGHERDGHCMIAWTTASQGPASVTPQAVAITGVLSGADLQFTSPPSARAIGPPAEGDPQAVLQVFRL